MPLRIAFDLDGVLADMESALVRQAERRFGPLPPSPDTVNESRGTGADDSEADPDPPPLHKVNLTARQQKQLWRDIGSIENFWEGLSEIEPGVVERLAEVSVARRWEVIFLTKRPETAGATAQVQTQRWLASRGFTMPSVYVVQGSRGRIAAALNLDVVVDDRPENCLDVVVDSRARAILVWRDTADAPAATKKLGIGVVRSVNDCLDVLTAATSSAPEPGMVARLKRMLGLDTPSSTHQP